MTKEDRDEIDNMLLDPEGGGGLSGSKLSTKTMYRKHGLRAASEFLVARIYWHCRYWVQFRFVSSLKTQIERAAR